jgi:hypothetical protein
MNAAGILTTGISTFPSVTGLPVCCLTFNPLVVGSSPTGPPVARTLVRPARCSAIARS